MLGDGQHINLDGFRRLVDQNWWNPTTQTATERFQAGKRARIARSRKPFPPNYFRIMPRKKRTPALRAIGPLTRSHGVP
jgi:hypothetical protein